MSRYDTARAHDWGEFYGKPCENCIVCNDAVVHDTKHVVAISLWNGTEWKCLQSFVCDKEECREEVSRTNQLSSLLDARARKYMADYEASEKSGGLGKLDGDAVNHPRCGGTPEWRKSEKCGRPHLGCTCGWKHGCEEERCKERSQAGLSAG